VTATDHLRGAIEWLVLAQDSRAKDHGFSAAFHLLKGGWLPSYPETTGYIINTMLAYGRLSGDSSYSRRSVQAGEWLLSTQLREGAFPGGYGGPNAAPRVFNTGMILFGLAELARVTRDTRFLAAGRRALDWLANTQDPDGSWTSVSPERQPHAYHARVAWAMVEMARCVDGASCRRHLDAASRAAEWVLTQEDADGWFRSNVLIPGRPPLTHNIAYVLRGLLEYGAAMMLPRFVEAALRGADPLLRDWQLNGYLAAGYGPGWRRGPSFRCVTGEAQLGLVWLRLGQLTGDRAYAVAAERIATQVSQTQSLRSPIRGIRGGIPGAWPLWGRYLPFAYPNWAAKFFADLLIELGASATG